VSSTETSGATVVVETPRLTLRHLTPADADSLAAVWSDAEAMRYFPRVLTPAEVKELIERNLQQYRKEGHGLYAVVLRASGEVIGDCGLVRQHVHGRDEIEVAYHLRSSVWGKGYATEAAGACLYHGFRRLGLNRIVVLVRPENQPACRVAEKLGMTVEKQVLWRGIQHLVYAVAGTAWAERAGPAGEFANPE
jgi:RimJ/RimL family protein N-acetyltransferase